jgi:hypothetical protein
VSSSVCGSLTPCAQYMTQFPFNISMNEIYSWTFQISLGYNKIILPQPVEVNKGHFILLTQNSGRIAIDTTGNSSYSDLVWNSTTQWTKLAEFSNWRFFLTTINNFTSYQNTLNIIHSYANIGLYNLTIIFPSSNLSFQQIVNITDCNFLFFY